MISFRNLFSAAHLFLLMACMAKAEAPLESFPKEKVSLFLLAGQSNMAGRGKIEPIDRKIHPRIFALSADGKWVPAVDPIHYDKKSAGVGLAKSFALALLEKDPDLIIGLIPAACGGSPISTWEPGAFHKQTKSHPYDDALERARFAVKSGELKAILWHQGESDSIPENAKGYAENLEALIARFRKDLNTPDLPFLIGQMGRFPKKPWDPPKEKVNAAQLSLSSTLHKVAFVKADRLTANQDQLHFNSSSLREFGKRYAKAYLKMTE